MPAVAVMDAAAGLFARLKAATVPIPGTLALTTYDPTVPLAVNVGAVATPVALVVAVAAVDPPGKVPLAKGDGPLDAPFLTVFQPPEGKRNSSSVVIAPGGSNIMLMYGLEGIDIAERFNDWGATAFVLTYRLSPKYGDDARALDGNRAIQLVRSRAKEWGLDPAKIGFAGFSAGSTMARAVVDSTWYSATENQTRRSQRS